MADKSAKLNLIKTFVNAASVMMKNLEIEDASDMRLWRMAKDAAELYPALQLAAMELNRQWGFRINLPETNEPKEAFEKAEDFYRLHSEIMRQAEGNDAFNQALILFNPADKSFINKADGVATWVLNNGGEFERYWLNKNMVLAASFTQEMQEEIFSRTLDGFLDAHLAEELMEAVTEGGGMINLSNVEGVRNVLADAAMDFSQRSGFVSEKKVAADIMKRLQRDCYWDVQSEPIKKAVGRFVKPFTEIVAQNRRDFFYYHSNNDTAEQIRNDFANIMGDEAYFQIERQKRANQRLGIKEMDIEIPKSYDLNKIFTEVDNFDMLEKIVPPFKAGSQEDFWEKYETAENMSPELTKDMEKMISLIVQGLDDGLAETVADLRQVEAGADNFGVDEEQDEFGEKWSAGASEDMALRQKILNFAEDALNVSDLVKYYKDVEINDTPVNKNVLRQIEAKADWDDFTYSALNMLFNSLDRNLDKNKDLLIPYDDMRENAVEELLALPRSLEKHNALKVFYRGLSVMEQKFFENKQREENFAAEDFTIYHQEDYQTLVDELTWGKEIFPSFTDDKVELLAYDVNRVAVLGHIIPLYNDTESDKELLSSLQELDSYASLSQEGQIYVGKLAQRHINRILKTHNQVLDEGNFDRELFEDVDNINNYQALFEDARNEKNMLLQARKEDMLIYKQFKAFRKTHPSRQKLLMNAMWQGRFCNN